MSKQNILVREFDRMRQYRMLVAIGLAIIIFSVWMLLFNSRTNATTVFWGMFDRSLKTSSVTRNVKDQTETSKADQSVRLITGEQYMSYNVATIEETNDQGTTKVVTETIGTPTANYARYKSIESTQPGEDGKPVDFSSVTGIWGKEELAEGKSGYFNEGFLGLVPFANLDQGRREGLINFMREKNVYETKLEEATKQDFEGHGVYVYKVKINPSAYIQLVIEFAKQAGLGELPGLDPEQYAQSQPLEVELSVDRRSHQLLKILYVANKREELYKDYDIKGTIDLPTDTIPLADLQSKLQKLQ